MMFQLPDPPRHITGLARRTLTSSDRQDEKKRMVCRVNEQKVRYLKNQPKPWAPGSAAAWGVRCQSQTRQKTRVHTAWYRKAEVLPSTDLRGQARDGVASAGSG